MPAHMHAIRVLPNSPSEGDPWPGLWASFVRSLRAAPVRPRTIEVYSEGGRQFHDHLVAHGRPTDPAAIEKRDVEEFLIGLTDRHAKPATVRARFSALRRFFNWLEAEEEIAHSPITRMSSPKVDEPPPGILTVDEQRALLAACAGKTFDDRRDTAIIRLMLDSGLRRGEVVGMKLDDLDLDGLTINNVIGKGGRVETAFFGTKTARDIDRYLRVRAQHPHAALEAVWLAQRGPLSGDGIHHLFSNRAKLAGIERPINPHATRHSWAHALKAAHATDEDVMTLGRWRDSRVMRRYGASVALERARETHRRLSPGDRL
jgi:site-specific recombinase XerD